MYTKELKAHYETYFDIQGEEKRWPLGPIDKLHPDFFILEIPPNSVHNMWAYLTVGMSLDKKGPKMIELVVYSPEKSDSVIELLTFNAAYHRNRRFLDLYNTVNIGQPWIHNSKCEYGYISLPHLDGEKLDFFEFSGEKLHCYWLIPITKEERKFKDKQGAEALERLFEFKGFNYLDPNRESLVDRKGRII